MSGKLKAKYYLLALAAFYLRNVQRLCPQEKDENPKCSAELINERRLRVAVNDELLYCCYSGM